MNETFLRGFPSWKEFLDLFTQVLCGFFGEGERENLGRVDVFFFDHVSDLRGDGRGLPCARACEDELGGLGVFYGFKLAGF